MKKKNKTSSKTNIIIIAVIFTVLVIYSLILLYFLGWGLITSLKSRVEVSPSGAHNIFGFPILDVNNRFNSREQFFKLANYKSIFDNLTIETYASYFKNGERVIYDIFGNSLISIKTSFIQCIFNTILYCGISVGTKVFVTGITAYIVAKYRYKFCKALYYVILFAMTVPLLGSQPAELDMLRNLGIYSTWFQCFIQAFNFSGLYFFVFYAFFVGFSDAYLEAAEIDGASQFKSLFTIVVPLASKLFFSVALILFVSYWNSYESVMIYMPKYPTLAYAIFDSVNKSNNGASDITIRMSTCMILVVPVLILFIMFHKTLMGNISLGGIKE